MCDCYVEADKSTVNLHEFSKLSILWAFKNLCCKSDIIGGSARAHKAAIGNTKVDKILYDQINIKKSYTCKFLWCPGEDSNLHVHTDTST